MRISDWSSDVCSSDLCLGVAGGDGRRAQGHGECHAAPPHDRDRLLPPEFSRPVPAAHRSSGGAARDGPARARSEEHTSELQSLMRISYAVFCLKQTNKASATRNTELYNHNESYHV